MHLVLTWTSWLGASCSPVQQLKTLKQQHQSPATDTLRPSDRLHLRKSSSYKVSTAYFVGGKTHFGVGEVFKLTLNLPAHLPIHGHARAACTQTLRAAAPTDIYVYIIINVRPKATIVLCIVSFKVHSRRPIVCPHRSWICILLKRELNKCTDETTVVCEQTPPRTAVRHLHACRVYTCVCSCVVARRCVVLLILLRISVFKKSSPTRLLLLQEEVLFTLGPSPCFSF